MKEQPLPTLTLKVLALGALVFGLYTVDFINLTWSETLLSAPLILLLVAIMDAAILSAAILRLRYYGWHLAIAVFLVFYGVKTFLVGIEAVYLGDVLPPDAARSLFLNGFITAAIFSPIATWTLGRWTRTAVLPSRPIAPTTRSLLGSLGSLLLAGLIYLILFIAGGLLVFTPVANALDPLEAASYSAGFQAPTWLPLFLLVRGALWALLALPLIRGLPAGRGSGSSFWASHARTGALVALLFAILMANNLLFPGDIAPTMRAAHFAELFVENFLYGLVLIWLFTPHL